MLNYLRKLSDFSLGVNSLLQVTNWSASISRMASQILGFPFAAVSLTAFDRQWFTHLLLAAKGRCQLTRDHPPSSHQASNWPA